MVDVEYYRTFVQDLFAVRATGVEGVQHALLGLLGETGEVIDSFKKVWLHGAGPLPVGALVQISEELGDLCFYYFALGRSVDGWEPAADLHPGPSGVDGVDVHLRLAQAVCEAASDAYAMEFQVTRSHMWKIGRAIARALVYHQLFLGVVLDANIVKLRKRFPVGYSLSASQARVDRVGEVDPCCPFCGLPDPLLRSWLPIADDAEVSVSWRRNADGRTWCTWQPVASPEQTWTHLCFS